MALSFFKPKQNGGGCAAFFSFNSKDAKVFVNLVRQVGNEKKFSGGEKTYFTLNTTEIAGIINSVIQQSKWTAFHTSEGADGTSQTHLNFGPYYKGEDFMGYALGMTRTTGGDKKNYNIGFKPDEAALLLEYLRFSLQHIFTADYSADKKAAEEKAANANPTQDKPTPKGKGKSNGKSKPNQTETAPKTQESAEDDPFADDAGDTTTPEGNSDVY